MTDRKRSKISPRIGILGGGQLGLMLLQAGLEWGLDISVLDPDPDASCRPWVRNFSVGSLQDYDTVYRFGRDLDLLTIEIEKVNVDALEALEKEGKKIYPQPSVLRIIQDKRLQKQFYQDNNLPTAEFVLTENREEIKNHPGLLPAVHKLGKDGYDGKGVVKIHDANDIAKGFDAPGVLEKMISYEKEIAVIVARRPSGEIRAFPTVEMVFHPEKNLVEYLFAPAELPHEINGKARKLAEKLAEALNITGLLAVEMFALPNGEVLINEAAPRPHNSGHHTLKANFTSQFEQTWRAVLDLPLGDTASICPAAMVNLLGEEGFEGPACYEGMETLLATKGVYPFLYGKKITKPFRKMGHIAILAQNLEALKEKVSFVRKTARVISDENN